MAVEVNKRKRKLAPNATQQAAGSQVVEEDEVIPKKIFRKSITPVKKEQQSMEQYNGDVESLQNGGRNIDAGVDSQPEQPEKPIKFSNDFKMLQFREKLRGNNFITELRHFLHLANTRSKIVAKYIEKRGKPLELAEALERIDKTNVIHVAYLCEALQLVLIEVLGNHKELVEGAVNTCRYFLKTHAEVADLLLNSAQLQHRRVALKLLTAIVVADPLLGRQLLSSFDILSNAKTINSLLSHSPQEMASLASPRGGPASTETVRKCFIHFVLSYLVDGNLLLIRNILDRGVLLKGLASGLVYDDHITVCMVLSTLKKYVLECPDISKTKKVLVFDVDCCKDFARLYDWQGHKGIGKVLGQKGKRGPAPTAEPETTDSAEREAVLKAAHDFLMTLMTSRKHGIAFDSITYFKQKHNNVQGKILGFLQFPWTSEHKTELIIKTLQACPDLARNTMRHFSGVVNPMRTGARYWVSSVNFLTQLIEALSPRILGTVIDKITLTDYSYWIKDICLPLDTLVLLSNSKMLRHEKFNFRLATVRLLLAMFRQYSNYLEAIRAREDSKKGGQSLRRFRFDLMNHILVNFPTMEEIMFSLFMSIKDQLQEEVDVLTHLEVTLDLVLVVCKEHRSLVSATATIVEYIQELRPLYASEDDEDAQDGEKSHGNITVEMKAIKTILLLYPKALNPESDLFRSVLQSFIKAFVYGEPEVQAEAGRLLHTMFLQSSIFDEGGLEVDLWLETLRCCDEATVLQVSGTFTEVLKASIGEVDLPNFSQASSEVSNLHKLFADIEQGLSVQAYVETPSLSKLMPLILATVKLEPTLVSYLDAVAMLMFHYYPQPKLVLQMNQEKLSNIQNYMEHWLLSKHNKKSSSALVLEGSLTRLMPSLKELQLFVLEGQKKMKDILSNQVVNERQLMIYGQLIMFVIVQLMSKEQLKKAQAERAALALNQCIDLALQLEQKSQSIDFAFRSKSCEGDDQETTHTVSCSSRLLQYIFSFRLGFIKNAEIFALEAQESHLNFWLFLRSVSEHCRNIKDFNIFTANYRLKTVKSVAKAMQQPDLILPQSDRFSECLKLMEALNLDAANCLEILNLVALQLKYTHFFISESGQRSVYYDVTVIVLQRLANLQEAVECPIFLRQLVQWYELFFKEISMDLNAEALEEALLQFLLVSHQHIPQLGPKFFNCFFMPRKLSKSAIRLASLLLERNECLHKTFVELLPEHLGKKELVYPLLKVLLKGKANKGSIETTLWQSLYQEYKNGFIKTIEKPQKAGVIYKENVECSLALIEACMPISECMDFCQKSLKFDSVESYQVKVIHAIYLKALKSLEADEASKERLPEVFINFLNLMVQLMSVDLKRQSVDITRMELFAFLLYAWWQEIEKKGASLKVHFNKVTQTQNWLNYCKSTLKIAMHIPEGANDSADTCDDLHGLMLSLLAFLSDKMYEDYTPDSFKEPAEPAQIFDMIWTHSKFYNILLSFNGQEGLNQVKTEILHLLYTLAKKSPSSLQSTQIPFVLGAYQAKLSKADRYALALLQLYEFYNCDLHLYRPFIWGESAVAFYALRATDDERLKLAQQETSITQVMSLVDKQTCEYTLENFPIWRKLDAASQIPRTEFLNPSLKALRFGSNLLEQSIESGLDGSQIAEAFDLRLCPKRESLYENCYDPAFFVPLMSLCFAPESYAHPARPVQNGLLSMVFAALSSQDRQMRLAAAAAQLRYRAHFEQNKFFERPLWVQAYDNIQSGLDELTRSFKQHKRLDKTPRVPYVSALFVAKTFNITTEPGHMLYRHLTSPLQLKSSFNFQSVPEFNTLYHSPEMEHVALRQFILEVIRQGIKCSGDLFLLVSTNTFKVLMASYGSSMSSLELNLQLLSLFSTCVKIPAAAKIMIEHVGILPWLNGIITSVEFHQFDVIEGLISILNNLWYALQANARELYNLPHIEQDIHRLVLLLLPHLSGRISLGAFARILHVLRQTAKMPHQLTALSAPQLDWLIECAHLHFPTWAPAIANVKRLGAQGVESHEAYCQALYEYGLESTSILALSSLRSYVIEWWRHTKTPTPPPQSPKPRSP